MARRHRECVCAWLLLSVMCAGCASKVSYVTMDWDDLQFAHNPSPEAHGVSISVDSVYDVRSESLDSIIGDAQTGLFDRHTPVVYRGDLLAALQVPLHRLLLTTGFTVPSDTEHTDLRLETDLRHIWVEEDHGFLGIGRQTARASVTLGFRLRQSGGGQIAWQGSFDGTAEMGSSLDVTPMNDDALARAVVSTGLQMLEDADFRAAIEAQHQWPFALRDMADSSMPAPIHFIHPASRTPMYDEANHWASGMPFVMGIAEVSLGYGTYDGIAIDPPGDSVPFDPAAAAEEIGIMMGTRVGPVNLDARYDLCLVPFFNFLFFPRPPDRVPNQYDNMDDAVSHHFRLSAQLRFALPVLHIRFSPIGGFGWQIEKAKSKHYPDEDDFRQNVRFRDDRLKQRGGIVGGEVSIQYHGNKRLRGLVLYHDYDTPVREFRVEHRWTYPDTNTPSPRQPFIRAVPFLSLGMSVRSHDDGRHDYIGFFNVGVDP